MCIDSRFQRWRIYPAASVVMNESRGHNVNANLDGQSAHSPEKKSPEQRESLSDVAQSNPRVPNDGKKRRWDFLRRFFWLDEKMAQIATAGMDINQSGWPEFELVCQARDGVLLLGDRGEDHAAVLILERTEVLFLIRALMKRHGLACPERYLSEVDWKTAEQVAVIKAALSSFTDNELEVLKTFLGPEAELSLVDIEPKRRRCLARALRRAAQQLIAPFDADADRIDYLRFQRWARIGAAIALALFFLGIGVVTLERHQRSTNMAFHRPVTASSYFPEFGHTKADQLVDGITTNMGFHTNNESNPFVVIDLGISKNIREFVVYNRQECCQERAVPLFIEVSDDGKKYHVIDERRESFDKWISTPPAGAKGRFVRFRLGKTEYFHLAEVEIY
jgi:hypothetical protein